MSRKVTKVLNEKRTTTSYQQTRWSILEVCCSVLKTMSSDPVYNVYVGALVCCFCLYLIVFCLVYLIVCDSIKNYFIQSEDCSQPILKNQRWLWGRCCPCCSRLLLLCQTNSDKSKSSFAAHFAFHIPPYLTGSLRTLSLIKIKNTRRNSQPILGFYF